VSAAAEVYITIDTATHDTRDKIESAVDMALRGLGFDIAADDRYKISRYQSGVIIEAKSYGCAWEVFEEKGAEKLVREIHAIDETTDMEVYVYNLDREADVCISSRYLFSENHMERGAV
jgi:ASC-1-like (ASCH) protein